MPRMENEIYCERRGVRTNREFSQRSYEIGAQPKK